MSQIHKNTAYAIRTALDTRHYSAPHLHVRRNDRNDRIETGHESFDQDRVDTDYLKVWLHHMAEEDTKRGDPDRARAWVRLADDLVKAAP